MDAFRKIDIDQYDEDTLLDSELVLPDPREPSTVLADARAKAGEVRGLLARCVPLFSFRPSFASACAMGRMRADVWIVGIVRGLGCEWDIGDLGYWDIGTFGILVH